MFMPEDPILPWWQRLKIWWNWTVRRKSRFKRYVLPRFTKDISELKTLDIRSILINTQPMKKETTAKFIMEISDGEK